jgi:hypothetical protein
VRLRHGTTREQSSGFEAARTTWCSQMADDFGGRPARRSLKVKDWPAADQIAWASAHRRGSLLEDDGDAVFWSPRSSSSIANSYGRFLFFIAATGTLDPAAQPQERVTPELVQAFIAHLREVNAPRTVASRIIHLSRAIAVMAPTRDWRWLSRIASRLQRSAPPVRDDRARLVPATVVRDPGFVLMLRAEADGGLSGYRRALLFRDGLMITIQCACALRVRNFAGMVIGTSLQRRGEEWWVAFEAGETKNKRPHETPLPAAYTGFIERYIAHHREELARRSRLPVAGNAFWVSGSGRAYSANDIGIRFRIVTKRELGAASTRTCLGSWCPPSSPSMIPVTWASHSCSWATLITGSLSRRTTLLVRSMPRVGTKPSSVRSATGPSRRRTRPEPMKHEPIQHSRE